MAGPGRQVYNWMMIVDKWTIRKAMTMIKGGDAQPRRIILSAQHNANRQRSSFI